MMILESIPNYELNHACIKRFNLIDHYSARSLLRTSLTLLLGHTIKSDSNWILNKQSFKKKQQPSAPSINATDRFWQQLIIAFLLLQSGNSEFGFSNHIYNAVVYKLQFNQYAMQQWIRIHQSRYENINITWYLIQHSTRMIDFFFPAVPSTNTGSVQFRHESILIEIDFFSICF